MHRTGWLADDRIALIVNHKYKKTNKQTNLQKLRNHCIGRVGWQMAKLPKLLITNAKTKQINKQTNK